MIYQPKENERFYNFLLQHVVLGMGYIQLVMVLTLSMEVKLMELNYNFCDMNYIGKNITNGIISRIIMKQSVNIYVYNMQKHLINDYIHILENHLNKGHMPEHKSNKQFNIIYETMIDPLHLICDIVNCYIYKNHRRRETQFITPICDDLNIAMFVGMLDVINLFG